jgi:hypothetical protein
MGNLVVNLETLGEALNLETSVESPKSAQPLGPSSKSLKFRTTNKVALHFKLSLSEPMAYTAFGRSTEVSRFKPVQAIAAPRKLNFY